MRVAHDAPARPALRYYGGKWKLAPWIISHFPAHSNYVEPCGGAASVLLQKPRSPLETYNDLDGSVVNFFRMLRDKPDELIRAIRLTPWARAEYELSLQPTDDGLERARRFFVKCWMSIGAQHNASNGQVRMHSEYIANPTRLYSESLLVVADRLASVQIENSDFGYVMRRYDTPNTLHYLDPPYVQSERSQPDSYNDEWLDEDHENAAEWARSMMGYVVVSGYACPLYTDLYESHGWHRVDREAQTNSGGKRTESLWLSPRTWAALNDEMSGLPLFAQEAR